MYLDMPFLTCWRATLDGQVDAGQRLPVLPDGVHEVPDLLRVAAEPVLVRARKRPARPGLDLLREVFLAGNYSGRHHPMPPA